jgi:hypothetical protein
MMFNDIDHAGLVDITTVKTDQTMSRRERIIEYVRQIKDPEHYMCGKFKITELHPDNGPSIEECLLGIVA